MTTRTYPKRCGKCGQKAMQLATVAYATTIEHDGRAYRVEIPALTVPRCGNCQTISIDEEADRQISAAFRREARLMAPEEIRQGREQLGLTQKQFANLLGVGEATVSRWETGAQIQQRAMDRFLRVCLASPAAVELLRSDFQRNSFGNGKEGTVMSAQTHTRRALTEYLHLRLERLQQCIATFEQQLSRDKDELCQMVDRGELRRDDPAIGRAVFHLEYVLGNTFRSTLFVGVCSVLEEALKEVTKLLVTDYGERMKKENGKKGNWLQKHIRVLTDAGIDLGPVQAELDTFDHCITLRNCVVHDSGRVAKAKAPDAVSAAVRHIDTAEISADGYLVFGDSVCSVAIWSAEEIVRHLAE
jgi:putative zinc finger/helix-turn-helix YgiT family protein